MVNFLKLEWSKNWNALKRRDVRLLRFPRCGLAFTSLSPIEFSLIPGSTAADEMWHIDTSVIRLLGGTRAYRHAVIDNFSRRILAWRVADTFAPVNSVVVLVEASRVRRPPRPRRSCWRTQASKT